MDHTGPGNPTYHALLIGIDAYATTPLRGCVNDIDDRTARLNAGIGDSNFTLDIKRLVAPNPPPAGTGAEDLATHLWTGVSGFRRQGDSISDQET